MQIFPSVYTYRIILRCVVLKVMFRKKCIHLDLRTSPKSDKKPTWSAPHSKAYLPDWFRRAPTSTCPGTSQPSSPSAWAAAASWRSSTALPWQAHWTQSSSSPARSLPASHSRSSSSRWGRRAPHSPACAASTQWSP